jgi:hypothetical protein
MARKTEQEIQEEIIKLKSLVGKIQSKNIFGDNNDEALAAVIQVLERNMDEDDIYDEWPEDEDDLDVDDEVDCYEDEYENVREEAMSAMSWRNGEADEEDGSLFDQWKHLIRKEE